MADRTSGVQVCPGLDDRAAEWDAWHQEWKRARGYGPGIADAWDAAYRAAWKRATAGVPPAPAPQLLERALAAMREVQERAEPGFAPDIACIPAEDWRAFIDAHAEVLMLWAAWRDSPYGVLASGKTSDGVVQE